MLITFRARATVQLCSRNNSFCPALHASNNLAVSKNFCARSLLCFLRFLGDSDTSPCAPVMRAAELSPHGRHRDDLRFADARCSHSRKLLGARRSIPNLFKTSESLSAKTESSSTGPSRSALQAHSADCVRFCSTTVVCACCAPTSS